MATDDFRDAPGDAEDPRLKSLDARLDAAVKREAERTAATDPSFGMTGKGSSQGQRVISVLLGYPIGGGVIGWVIGKFVGGMPWPMLALMFAGFAAGCWQIWKISQERPE